MGGLFSASVDELAADVSDGSRLAIGKEETGAALAATLALIRKQVRSLHLICLPVSGLQADLLIGAGCVDTVETSGLSLGEAGIAPCFSRAVRCQSIRVIDGTCPAIYAGFQAAQKGIPFMPLRGILGSDLLRHRRSWKVIDNPFASDSPHAGMGDPLVAVEAIVPDVALFHARSADLNGNVFLGRDRDGMLLAHASHRTLVTVEALGEEDLLNDPLRAGATLPELYVSGIARVPRGAAPLGFAESYRANTAFLHRYARLAASNDGFLEVLEELQWMHRLDGAETEPARTPQSGPG
jgi:glutaconate CoA-transferase subunit A